MGTGDSVNAVQWERNIAHPTPFTADRVNGAMVSASERTARVAGAKRKAFGGGVSSE